MKLFRDVIQFTSNLEKLSNTQCAVKLFRESNGDCTFVISAADKEYTFCYCQEFGFGLIAKNEIGMFWEDNIPDGVINAIKGVPECKIKKYLATLKHNQRLVYIKHKDIVNSQRLVYIEYKDIVNINNNSLVSNLSTNDGSFYKIESVII